MQNISKYSEEKLYLNVFKDGYLTQADSLPTLAIYDADGDTTPISGYSSCPVIDELDNGVYGFQLTSDLTSTNRVIELVWTYNLGGVVTKQRNYYSVETVYATPSDIIDFFQYGSTPADLNYQDEGKLVTAEKVARTIVDGYTGQKFTSYYGSQEVFGKGGDAVELVERMLSIDKVYENDILVIDNTQNPVFNTFGFPLQISPTGFGIRIFDQGWDVRYDNNVDPAVLYYGRFRDNARYSFQGLIGYKYVPEDIKIATMLLVNDILANDFNWRNKYLSKVNLSEISFEMAGGAFNGTGNVTVDNILDQYRHVNIVII